ncbi:MAG: O-Antigen ligase [bacterium ADurb.Bin400]|nr:MAG: O-Antigen ligase [bacterium ADurb.Bin400]
MGVITLSTLFSIDPGASFWGVYPHFNVGLLLIFVSTLFYYVVLFSVPSKRDIIKFSLYLVVIGGIVGLLTIFEHFSWFGLGSETSRLRAHGIYKNADYTFSFLVFVLPLSFCFWEKSKSWLRHLLVFSSFVFMLFGLFFLAPEGFQQIVRSILFGWVSLTLLGLAALAYVLLRCFNRDKIEAIQNFVQQKQKLAGLLGVVAIVLAGLALATGPAKEFLNDSSNSQRFWAWRAGIQNGLDHPLLGTGPSTVQYFLPLIRDKIPFDDWDDTTTTTSLHNEPIDYFATSGFLGLISYLLLWGAVFYFGFKGVRAVPENRRLILSWLSALTLFMGFNLFFFITVGTMLLPWTAAAFILILSGNVLYSGEAKPIISRGWFRGLAYLVAATFVASTYIFVSYWMADYYYDKSSKTNNYQYLEKAVSTFPLNDVYLMKLSDAGLSRVLQGVDVKNAESIESQKTELVAAIQSAEKAVAIRPLGQWNWVRRGGAALILEKIDDAYEGQADQSFKKALDLNPKSEMLRLGISVSYWRAGNLDKAIEYAKEATALANEKTLGRCHAVLGQFYYAREQYDEALSSFNAAREYLQGGERQTAEEYIREIESAMEQ